MKDVATILSELEDAIRGEYDVKIRALEEERDLRLGAVQGLAEKNGGRPEPREAGPLPTSRTTAPTGVSSYETRKTASAETVPSAQASSNGRPADRIRAFVAAATGNFSTRDVRAALPDLSTDLVGATLRAMAERGDLVLVQNGMKNAKPAIYRRKLAAVPSSRPAQKVKETPKDPGARVEKIRAWVLARSGSFTKADVEKQFAATHEEYPLVIAGLLAELVHGGRLSITPGKGTNLYTPATRPKEARA